MRCAALIDSRPRGSRPIEQTLGAQLLAIAGVALGFAAVGLATGCSSAEEKCAAARTSAAEAWAAYAQVVEAARDTADARVKEIAVAMRGEIDKRLSRVASAEASRLHNEGTAEWHRTFAARRQAACSSDGECSRLRLESRTAEQQIASLTKRSQAARAAKAAATGGLQAAQTAAQAPEDDFEFQEFKVARTRSREAHSTCLEVD